MTALDEVTGNPDRSIAILALVHEAAAEGKLTLDNVGLKAHRFDNDWGPFGPVGEDEYGAAVAMARPVEFSAVEPVGDNIAEALHAPAAVAEPVAGGVQAQADPIMSHDEAVAELRARQEALHLARLDHEKALTAQRTARAAMATAIAAWSSEGPSKEEIRRREIAAINADRAARAAQGPVQAPRVLRSRIDAEAHYGSGGDAATHVRAQHRYGSFHRPARGDDGLFHRPGKRGSTVPSER
jgi:hypothetical protein